MEVGFSTGHDQPSRSQSTDANLSSKSHASDSSILSDASTAPVSQASSNEDDEGNIAEGLESHQAAQRNDPESNTRLEESKDLSFAGRWFATALRSGIVMNLARFKQLNLTNQFATVAFTIYLSFGFVVAVTLIVRRLTGSLNAFDQSFVTWILLAANSLILVVPRVTRIATARSASARTQLSPVEMFVHLLWLAAISLIATDQTAVGVIVGLGLGLELTLLAAVVADFACSRPTTRPNNLSRPSPALESAADIDVIPKTESQDCVSKVSDRETRDTLRVVSDNEGERPNLGCCGAHTDESNTSSTVKPDETESKIDNGVLRESLADSVNALNDRPFGETEDLEDWESEELPDDLVQRVERLRQSYSCFDGNQNLNCIGQKAEVDNASGDRKFEMVSAIVRVPIEAGQKTVVSHISFCPPLPVRPQVQVHQVSGPEASIKTTRIETFGVRLELRFSKPVSEAQLLEASSVMYELLAEAEHPSRSTAKTTPSSTSASSTSVAKM